MELVATYTQVKRLESGYEITNRNPLYCNSLWDLKLCAEVHSVTVAGVQEMADGYSWMVIAG